MARDSPWRILWRRVSIGRWSDCWTATSVRIPAPPLRSPPRSPGPRDRVRGHAPTCRCAAPAGWWCAPNGTLGDDRREVITVGISPQHTEHVPDEAHPWGAWARPLAWRTASVRARPPLVRPTLILVSLSTPGSETCETWSSSGPRLTSGHS